MILIAGGSGRLGTRVVRLLTGRGLPMRVLTRDRSRARHLEADLVEIMEGDVRDPAAAARATAGTQAVISAVHGFAGTGSDNPRTVDAEGNRNLIRAAREAGAEHFILMSILGAASDHPIELFRAKHQAELELKESGPAWTIIRPSAYMETWAEILAEPLIRTGKTRIFGRGTNPINFVSVCDVARFVELAVVDPELRGKEIDVGGPESLSMKELLRTVESVTGKTGSVSRVPLPMMRLMSVLMRPVNPALARQIQAGVVMDTHDMSFDPTETSRLYPSIPLTSLQDVVRREYLEGGF